MDKEYVLPFTGIEIEEKLKEIEKLSENNELLSNMSETLEAMATEISKISSAMSGGAVETIILTISNSNFSGIVRYTDKNYSFNELEITPSPDYDLNSASITYTIECIKGSFVAFSGYGFLSDDLPQNFGINYDRDYDEQGLHVYYFDSDTSMAIRNGEGW